MRRGPETREKNLKFFVIGEIFRSKHALRQFHGGLAGARSWWIKKSRKSRLVSAPTGVGEALRQPLALAHTRLVVYS